MAAEAKTDPVRTRHAVLLDQIVDGSVRKPPAIATLQIPPITGWEPGRVTGCWTVDEGYFHAGGAVFGGYLAALADSALALAALTVLDDDESLATSDLRTSFFRPVVGHGELTTFEAVVVNRSRTTVFVEFTLSDATGRLLVKSSATQVVLRG